MTRKPLPKFESVEEELIFLQKAVKARSEARDARKRAKKGLPPRKEPKPVRIDSALPEGYTLDDTACSFQEWVDAGYCVMKGQKSRLTDILGVPQFTLDQVKKANPAWEKWRERNKAAPPPGTFRK